MKIIIILGTRPEILKFTSIIRELEKRRIKYEILFTSQHFSPEMGENFFKELKIKNFKTYKGVFTQQKVIKWLERKLKYFSPNIVLVQGDTFSALYGTIAATNLQIPVGHVEAGLRSFDFSEPFPEELNRTMIDSISTYLFCPTEENYLFSPENPLQKKFLVGNTIIDLVNSYGIKKTMTNNILITIHRRENWNRIERICEALKNLSIKHTNYNFIFVTHANKKLATGISNYLRNTNIKIMKPKPYEEFITLMANSSLIITDSGGLIEEASYFGVPLVSVREKTERIEAFNNGCAILVGTEPENIKKEISSLLTDDKRLERMSSAGCPFGDGVTAERIITILEEVLK